MGTHRESRTIDNDKIEMGAVMEGKGDKSRDWTLVPSWISHPFEQLTAFLRFWSFALWRSLLSPTFNVVSDKVTRRRELEKCPEGIRNACGEAGA